MEMTRTLTAATTTIPRWMTAICSAGGIGRLKDSIADPVMSMTLFAVLIGESMGVIRGRRKVAAAVIFQIALATVSFVRLSGWANFPAQGLLVLAISGFVILYVSLFGRMAEARARSQALLQELEIAHEQLAEYATRVEDLTRTAERERMARELHDTLAQGLTGLILQLEAADAHLSEGRAARAQEIVRQAMARARTTLADSRRVIDDLRAGQSGSAGLAEEVRKEAGRFTAATGIPCLVELDALDDVPGDVVEHARRVVAEALANITHHAQAQRVMVTIRGEDDRLLITVGDDGVGFEPAIQEIESGHYGLIGMRERARLVGGSLNIVSAPGQGTTLSVQLPYHSGNGEPSS